MPQRKKARKVARIKPSDRGTPNEPKWSRDDAPPMPKPGTKAYDERMAAIRRKVFGS